MGWIDYDKKVYDVIPHSWIFVSFEKMQMSENIVQFIRKLMKNWNTDLPLHGEYLA